MDLRNIPNFTFQILPFGTNFESHPKINLGNGTQHLCHLTLPTVTIKCHLAGMLAWAILVPSGSLYFQLIVFLAYGG